MAQFEVCYLRLLPLVHEHNASQIETSDDGMILKKVAGECHHHHHHHFTVLANYTGITTHTGHHNGHKTTYVVKQMLWNKYDASWAEVLNVKMCLIEWSGFVRPKMEVLLSVVEGRP